jgi:hypothetical protein
MRLTSFTAQELMSDGGTVLLLLAPEEEKQTVPEVVLHQHSHLHALLDLVLGDPLGQGTLAVHAPLNKTFAVGRGGANC